VRAGGEPKPLRDGLGDIGERFTPADRASSDAFPEGENRNMLARVIKASPNWIVAMIGGDDAEIINAHRRRDFWQAYVEGFEAGGVASDIAAMAKFRVEIYEIYENERAFPRLAKRGQSQIDVIAIAGALPLASGIPVGKDVADLADADDFAAGASGALQQVAAWRRHGEILAMRGARKIGDRIANKRSCDNAADVERVAKLARDSA
jgi:hypothetical protein